VVDASWAGEGGGQPSGQKAATVLPYTWHLALIHDILLSDI